MIVERPLRSKVDIQAWDSVEEEWQTWIDDATNITIKRGGRREGLGVKTDVGLLTFQLKDAQDPLDGGTFYPGQAVRVVSHNGSEKTPIFTGRIAYFGSVYPMDKSTGKTTTRVTVTVADAVQIHGSTMRYGVDLGEDLFETFEERIERLEGSANAPVEVPEVGAPREVYSF